MKLIDIFENNTGLNNRSDEEQLAAVKQDGYVISCIKNPSPEVQLAAVKTHGLAIQFIKNPSPEVQLAAVKKWGDVIRWIENPSPEVQLAAVNQNGDAIQYIKNPPHEWITLPSIIRNKDLYDATVKKIYPNNNLLIKKWIRYGDTMREEL